MFQADLSYYTNEGVIQPRENGFRVAERIL